MTEQIYNELRTIIDPEVGFDIVSLGLIYNVEIVDNKAIVTMTLSTKSCPLHDLILTWVKDSIKRVDDSLECEINLVWEPEWNISMASDEVKKAIM